MSAKKKNKKKSGSKKLGGKAKLALKRKPAKKSPPKNLKKKPASKKRPVAKKGFANKRSARGKREVVDSVAFDPKGLGPRSGGQSGDLQGLSNREGSNSESVDELLEEGNAFEAEVVKGVEDAPDADEGEVRTHEVLEDDVPDEYLEKN
jgi:hypothetical protein